MQIFGRAFDGFERSLTTQLAGLDAGHQLLEIEDLQREVVEGTLATDGRADVLMLITDWLPSLIESGKLRPIEQDQSAYAPALRALQTGADGRSYGVAYHDGPMLFLYRTDLYGDAEEQRGFHTRFGYPLAPPADWSQFRDQALWFDRPADGLRGTVQAGYPDEHNNVYDFLTHLWSRGGELIGPDGRSGLSSPAAAEAIEFLHALWHVDRVVDPAAATWDSVSSGEHFATGEAAMMVNWAGFAAMCEPGTVGCAPVPGAVTMNAYWVLTIPAGAPDPSRSADLIRHLTTHEMDVVTALSGGSATRRDSWADPRVRALSPYYEVLESAHQHSRSVPADPRWPRMAAILNEMMRAVIEDAEGKAALDRAHLDLDALLAP
ncbi:extracellular solute-binding protein [Actinoplanes bogorensis]|uniref:Extracellular solute-binding protein n=1 Tax=Paractinoplanes bogorensis TaxID=1610840 RepID=A0ABS5Z2E3_9ACTN|nr:extracellular solute-binding protein [Actinoplanes bogorensis]MBU2669866.1 extracellular solute-binding protein [Actinoplanes bogorensis]